MGAEDAACFIEIKSKGCSDDAHEEESHNCWTECTLWRGERWESVSEEGVWGGLEITKKEESENRDLELDWRGGEWNKAAMEASRQRWGQAELKKMEE